MKVITFEDINALGITPAECFTWAEFMIRNKKKAILPPKISMKPEDGIFCNVMPSIIPGNGTDRWCGVKVVTRYPHRVPSLESRILLEDSNTGEFLAVMDGTWITTMRTGAVAAHSIDLLAKKDFKTMGIMGLGNVSRSTMLILADRMPDREFHVKLLRYKDQAEDFMNRFSSFPNLCFTIVDTPEEMVKGSDVVISGATFLPTDVCEDRYFDEGVLVQPIHTLGFTNCDLFFDKVYADDTGHVHHFKNFDKFRNFAEVGEVVNGEKPGRESDSERILVYNIGVSVHDMYYAASIYNRLKNAGALDKLPDLDMKDPSVKFWV